MEPCCLYTLHSRLPRNSSSSGCIFISLLSLRGWTPEGPQKDGDEETLHAPGVKLEGRVEEGADRCNCKLKREG